MQFKRNRLPEKDVGLRSSS